MLILHQRQFWLIILSSGNYKALVLEPNARARSNSSRYFFDEKRVLKSKNVFQDSHRSSEGGFKNRERALLFEVGAVVLEMSVVLGLQVVELPLVEHGRGGGVVVSRNSSLDENEKKFVSDAKIGAIKDNRCR